MSIISTPRLTLDKGITPPSLGRSVPAREFSRDKTLQKLSNAAEEDYRNLQPFREAIAQRIRQYVGRRWGPIGSREKVPIGMIELMTNVYISNLAMTNPHALVVTNVRALKPIAKNLSIALDMLLSQLRWDVTLQKVVLDALFGMGIQKIGLKPANVIEDNNINFQVSQPFAKRVFIDDWVHDMRARSMDMVQYQGNRWTMTLDDLRNNDMFDREVAMSINQREAYMLNPGGDERVESFQREISPETQDFDPLVELWDIWIPGDNILATFPGDPEGGFNWKKALRVIEWDGPREGPYQILSFAEVPNNTMPLPPVAVVEDLHDLINQIFRKLGRQAGRQKTVGVVGPSAEQDAKNIVQAADGELIRANHPERVSELNFGGISQENMAMFLQSRQLFSYLAGNIDLIGGLAAQSPTARQDVLLAGAASNRLTHMRRATDSFAETTMRHLGFYLWHDPLITIPMNKRIPRVNVDIATTFTPEQRQHEFFRFNIKIVPHSMITLPPEQRLQRLISVFTELVIPLFPAIQAQGGVVNFQDFFDKVGQYSGHPEDYTDLILFSGPQENAEPTGAGLHQPSTSTRRYIRENRSGKSGQSALDDMTTKLLQTGGSTTRNGLDKPITSSDIGTL